MRLLPFFEPLDRFEELHTEEFHFKPSTGIGGNPPQPSNLGASRILHLEGFSYHQRSVILKFRGIEDMDSARMLVGGELLIAERELWPMAEGEYFTYQLAGLTLMDAESGLPLGMVRKVVDGAAHDFLEVTPVGDGRTFLVPFVLEFIKKVDIKAGEIRAKLPAGLMDL